MTGKAFEEERKSGDFAFIGSEAVIAEGDGKAVLVVAQEVFQGGLGFHAAQVGLGVLGTARATDDVHDALPEFPAGVAELLPVSVGELLSAGK